MKQIFPALLLGVSMTGLALTSFTQVGHANPPGQSSSEAAPAGIPDDISANQATELLRDDGFILVDVRTPAEWRTTGIPAPAGTATLGDENFLEQVEAMTGGDKEAPVAFICRSGSRSAKARDRLQAAGYTNVTSVAGGMSGKNGWLDEDLPVEPWP